MSEMSLIGSAITSLNAAMNIAKGMVSAHDVATIQSKVIELQSEIMSAQSSALSAQSDQFTLLNRIRELEKEVADLKAWGHEKERYELKRIGERSVAYMLKKHERGSEPPHWVCQNCYQDHRIIALQHKGRIGNDVIFECPKCHAAIREYWTTKPVFCD